MVTAWPLQAPLAVGMAMVAGYHLTSLVRGTDAARAGRGWIRHLTHAAMGVAMLLMLVGAMTPRGALVWLAVLLVPTTWFAIRALRGFVAVGAHEAADTARQSVLGAGMVFMLAITAAGASGPHHTASAGMAGMSMPAPATPDWTAHALRTGTALALIALTVVVCGWLVWTVRRGHVRLAARGCQVAMGVTTICMLAAAV